MLQVCWKHPLHYATSAHQPQFAFVSPTHRVCCVQCVRVCVCACAHECVCCVCVCMCVCVCTQAWTRDRALTSHLPESVGQTPLPVSSWADHSQGTSVLDAGRLGPCIHSTQSKHEHQHSRCCIHYKITVLTVINHTASLTGIVHSRVIVNSINMNHTAHSHLNSHTTHKM